MNEPSMSFDAIANDARRQHSTVEHMVYNAIRNAIMTGAFRPGEKLSQDRIAEELGVSRMPVRTSLQQLESEGLVVMRPYRGAVVRSLSPAEVAELYELRILLETTALHYVAEHITDAELAELTGIAGTMDNEDDPISWMERRQDFYARLYAIAGRPRMLKLILNLRTELGPYWLSLRVSTDSDGHVALINALQSRDGSGAATWLREHLTEVSERLQKLIADEQRSQKSDEGSDQ